MLLNKKFVKFQSSLTLKGLELLLEGIFGLGYMPNQYPVYSSARVNQYAVLLQFGCFCVDYIVENAVK